LAGNFSAKEMQIQIVPTDGHAREPAMRTTIASVRFGWTHPILKE